MCIQTDRLADIWTFLLICRQATDRQICIHTHSRTDTHVNRQAGRQMVIPLYRLTDIQTERQTERQTYIGLHIS